MRTALGFLAGVLLCCTAVAGEPITGYVFANGTNHSMMTGSRVNLHRALRIRDAYEAPFLWFQQGESSYLIRDTKTLDAIASLFAPVRNDPALARLHERIAPLERREAQLDHRLDAIEDADDDHSVTVSNSESRSALEHQMREVESQLRNLDREEERLEAENDHLELEAERAMVPILERSIRDGLAKRQ